MKLTLFIMAIISALGCAEKPATPQTPPRQILTFGSTGWEFTMNVTSQLNESVGSRVTLNGFAEEKEGQAVLRVIDRNNYLFITVKDKKKWEDAPSWRSSLLVVTGFLSKEDGKFTLSGTQHQWGDR